MTPLKPLLPWAPGAWLYFHCALLGPSRTLSADTFWTFLVVLTHSAQEASVGEGGQVRDIRVPGEQGVQCQ